MFNNFERNQVFIRHSGATPMNAKVAEKLALNEMTSILFWIQT